MTMGEGWEEDWLVDQSVTFGLSFFLTTMVWCVTPAELLTLHHTSRPSNAPFSITRQQNPEILQLLCFGHELNPPFYTVTRTIQLFCLVLNNACRVVLSRTHHLQSYIVQYLKLIPFLIRLDLTPIWLLEDGLLNPSGTVKLCRQLWLLSRLLLKIVSILTRLVRLSVGSAAIPKHQYWMWE